MSLDPDPAEMRRLAHHAVERVVRYLEGLPERRAVTPPDRAAFRAAVREPLPRAGHGIEAGVDRFFDRLMPLATLVHHPRFFAYVPGPGSFAGALGELLAAATNTFAGTSLGGAVMTELEVQVLDWLREALGLPPEFAHGILTTGGSLANLGALAAARARAGGDPRGLTVLCSAEAHYSVAKAARVLGVPPPRVITVPVDDEQRMALDPLERELQRCDPGRAVVVATLGTTSTGAVDPIAPIAALCADRDAWLHVDGAWGAAYALLPEERELRELLARADSITLDPHKGLYCPFESGCLLTRRPADLRNAFAADGAYMQDVPRDLPNFFELGPELTRGNRALKLWLLLRSVGIDAIADALREDVRRCRRAFDRLVRDPRVRVATPPRLSVFSFTVAGGESVGRELVRRIHEDGFLMLSSTRVRGEFALRFCVLNHRTTDADVDRSVDRVLALLDSVSAA